MTTTFKLPPAELSQAYLDRWQIEVLQGDLKRRVGLGQAKCRKPRDVERIHSSLAAINALLLIGVRQTQMQARTEGFHRLPKWQWNHRQWWARKRVAEGKAEPVFRASVGDITTLLRRTMANLIGDRRVA